MTTQQRPSEEPLVTVVLATHNRPKLLKIAIQSVLDQTYRNIELVVVNDGGEDVGGIVQSFKDSRIKYFSIPINMGAAHSYNHAIYESSGQYITYLADDDRYYPNHCEVLVRALENHPEMGGAYSDQYQVDCDLNDGEYTAIHKKWVRYSQDFDKLTLIGRNNYIPQPCFMHRRSLLKKAGYYDQDQKVLIDFDLLRRMAFYTDFLHVPIITGEYFFPVNNKKRISDLASNDPDKFQEYNRRALSKLPDKPWDRLKTFHIVIYSPVFNKKVLDQLNYILSNFTIPQKIYILLDQYDPFFKEANKKLTQIPLLYKGFSNLSIKMIFNSNVTGERKSIQKFLNTYMTEGWFMYLNESTPMKDNGIWIRIFNDLRGILNGTYTDPSDIFPDTVYQDYGTALASRMKV